MDTKFIFECVLKLFLAAVCGFLLGLERKKHNHGLGILTLVLICVSSTLLSLLSSHMASNSDAVIAVRGDPTRIASGVISGIGFLGGGAIMKTGLNIRGLTSAAVIWTSASIGLALGAGLYIQVGVTLALVLVFLMSLENLETKWFPAAKCKTIHICYEDSNLDLKKVRQTISEYKLVIVDMNMSRLLKTNQIFLHYTVKSPAGTTYSSLVEKLKLLGNLSEFSVTD